MIQSFYQAVFRCAKILPVIMLIWCWFWLLIPGEAAGVTEGFRVFTDAMGRRVQIPWKVERVICSGAGCLRLLTYLQAHDRAVAVDSIELFGAPVNARPYAIANPRFQTLPLFGEFRGKDNPELIAGLNPQPQVIFKTLHGHQSDLDQLEAKTGIPVVALAYGNMTYGRETLHQTLRLMGDILGVGDRAEEVIAFFAGLESDLKQRTRDIPQEKRPRCYIGGLAQSGPHGFQSTEPSFASFALVDAVNVAAPQSKSLQPVSHAVVGKEQILFWDPDVIFVDISTAGLGPGVNAIDQLQSEMAFRHLRAVKAGRVYGLFPYNSYTQNFEAVFANAYYVGKILYPQQFSDIDPLTLAEEFSTFLNGGAAFAEINRRLGGLGFCQIPLKVSGKIQ